jgi:DNA-binding NtrC family response regulator
MEIPSSPNAPSGPREGLTQRELAAFDVILIDPQQLKQSPPPSPLERFTTEKRLSAGAHSLLKACESWRLLDRVLVNVASFELLALEATQPARIIEELVTGYRVGVVQPGPEAEGLIDLLAKIAQIASLRRLGYHCDARVRDLLMLVARRVVSEKPEPVIIWGESGTGKETAARHLHQLGQWLRKQEDGGEKDLPLEVVHCGALSPELSRGELFGHVRGAYTDAGAHTFGRLLRSLGCVRGRMPDVGKAKADVLTDLKNLEELAQQMQNVSGAGAGTLRPDVVSGQLAGLAKKLGAWVEEHWQNLARTAARAAQGSTDPSEEYASLIESTRLFVRDGARSLHWRIKTEAPFGTLFLDEFGELPVRVQVMLLRFLEYGEIEPLGYEGKISLIDDKDRHHLRIVVATSNPSVAKVIGLAPHEALATKTQLGRVSRKWRDNVVKPDLVFRLNQWRIALPRLQTSEVTHLIDIEKETTEFTAVQWRPEAIEELERMVTEVGVPGNRRQMRQIVRRCMAIANEFPRLSRITAETGVVTKNVVVEAAADIRLEVPQPPETLARDVAQTVSPSRPPKPDYVKLLRNAIDRDVQTGTKIDISKTTEFAAIRGKISDRSHLCKLILQSARFHLLTHEFTASEISEAWRAGKGSSGISNFLKRNCKNALKELYGEIPPALAADENRTAGALLLFARREFRKSGAMVEIA